MWSARRNRMRAGRRMHHPDAIVRGHTGSVYYAHDSSGVRTSWMHLGWLLQRNARSVFNAGGFVDVYVGWLYVRCKHLRWHRNDLLRDIDSGAVQQPTRVLMAVAQP
jgi:hypothetical protein